MGIVEQFLGVELGTTGRFIAALGIVLLLLAVGALIVRYMFGRSNAAARRGRVPRLAILEIIPVDTRRRLVLLRRDNIEHLVMIGGPTDVVVEDGILRTARGNNARAGAQNSPAPSTRPAWGAEPAWAQDLENGNAQPPQQLPSQPLSNNPASSNRLSDSQMSSSQGSKAPPALEQSQSPDVATSGHAMSELPRSAGRRNAEGPAPAQRPDRAVINATTAAAVSAAVAGAAIAAPKRDISSAPQDARRHQGPAQDDRHDQARHPSGMDDHRAKSAAPQNAAPQHMVTNERADRARPFSSPDMASRGGAHGTPAAHDTSPEQQSHPASPGRPVDPTTPSPATTPSPRALSRASEAPRTEGDGHVSIAAPSDRIRASAEPGEHRATSPQTSERHRALSTDRPQFGRGAEADRTGKHTKPSAAPARPAIAPATRDAATTRLTQGNGLSDAEANQVRSTGEQPPAYGTGPTHGKQDAGQLGAPLEAPTVSSRGDNSSIHIVKPLISKDIDESKDEARTTIADQAAAVIDQGGFGRKPRPIQQSTVGAGAPGRASGSAQPSAFPSDQHHAIASDQYKAVPADDAASNRVTPMDRESRPGHAVTRDKSADRDRHNLTSSPIDGRENFVRKTPVEVNTEKPRIAELAKRPADISRDNQVEIRPAATKPTETPASGAASSGAPASGAASSGAQSSGAPASGAASSGVQSSGTASSTVGVQSDRLSDSSDQPRTSSRKPRNNGASDAQLRAMAERLEAALRAPLSRSAGPLGETPAAPVDAIKPVTPTARSEPSNGAGPPAPDDTKSDRASEHR